MHVCAVVIAVNFKGFTVEFLKNNEPASLDFHCRIFIYIIRFYKEKNACLFNRLTKALGSVLKNV